MIRGVGVDIVEIGRFEGVMERYGERLQGRLFTEGEVSYCEGKRRANHHYAARFAAKEAVIKAIGTRLPFRDIEVVRGEKGKPLIHVKGYEKGYRWNLSLTHDGDYALACVIMEAESEAG